MEYTHACKQLAFLPRRDVLPPATVQSGRLVAERVFQSLQGDVPAYRPLQQMVFEPTQPAEVECICMACDDSSCNFQPIKMFRRPVGDWDVCINVLFCGVCHSDLSYGASRLPTHVHLPAVLGHEAVGLCTLVGAKVTRFKPGDHVGVGNLVDSCRRCHFCMDGEEQWCSRHVPTYGGKDWSGRAAMGGGVKHTLGGYSTAMVVHQHFCIRIPLDYPLECAAPVMCAGTTMYAPIRRGLNDFRAKAPSEQTPMWLGVAGLGGLWCRN